MKKSQKTKEIIFEKAMEIVAAKGYSASSTKEIAESAGVSEATLFKYYGSKEELLKQIVLKTLDSFVNYALNESIPQIFERNTDQPVASLLKEILIERINFFQRHTPAMRVIFQEMMINDSVRRAFKDKVWYAIVEMSDKIFNIGKAQKEMKDIDNYLLRKVFVGTMIFSFIFENVVMADENREYNPEEEITALIDILFNGVKEE